MRDRAAIDRSWFGALLFCLPFACNVYDEDPTSHRDAAAGNGTGPAGMAGNASGGGAGDGPGGTSGGGGSRAPDANVDGPSGRGGNAGGDRDAAGAGGTAGNGARGGAAGASADSGPVADTAIDVSGGADALDGSGGAAGNGASGSGGAGGAAGTGGAGAAGAGGNGASAGAAGTGGAGGGGTGGAAGTGASAGAAGTGGASGSGGAADSGSTDTGAQDAPADVDAGVCSGGVCKRVFVTSASPATNGNFGGLAGADSFCQSSADTRQLGGTWKAWLSTSSTSAASRLVHATVPYRLLDGSTIAANWTALTSGTLSHVVNVTETGVTVPSGSPLEVWTGTNTTGAYSGKTCNGWVDGTSTPTAHVGLTSGTGSTWTFAYEQFCDRTNLRLYCFEQ